MKYTKFILLAVGFSALLASCQCKTCTKTAEPTYTICKDEGTENEYNSYIDNAVNNGYTCN